MVQSRERYEFDLGPGDQLVIGDLVLTVQDIAAGEACVLMESTGDGEGGVTIPLAEVVCE